MMYKEITFYIIGLLLIGSCKTMKQILPFHQTPHEEYLTRIKDAGLDENNLGQKWITSGEEALNNALNINIPFSKVFVFNLEDFNALSYRIMAKEGQNLHILVKPEEENESRIFIDLYQKEPENLKHMAYAPKDSLNIDFRIKRDGEYIIRIQPEMLTQGLFSIYIFTDASLNFPIPGKNFQSIASFFGDPRDGGRRRHEGVDIFAPRGTPALAVSSGRVSRTGTNRLGGKVVWITDSEKGYNYYYAHLDSQLVYPGKRVAPGDTIGLIGNTGNAITTPPHLHFGIYAFGRRAIDPYVFFQKTESKPIDPQQIENFAGNWGQTSGARTNFRSAPGTNADIILTLSANTPVMIKGITDNWLRVELPDGETGFVHHSLIQTIQNPSREYLSDKQKVIRSKPVNGSPATGLVNEHEMVSVYSEYDSFLLIRSGSQFGWVETEA